MKGFPGSSEAKRLPVMRKSWVRSMGHEDPLEEEPTPVFLPGKFHGRRSLIGHSPWDRKESRTWLSDFTLYFALLSLVAQLIKNPPTMRETWVRPWVGKIPWRRLPTPVFWPGEFHGLYSPWGGKELDMTEQLSLSLSFKVIDLVTHVSTFLWEKSSDTEQSCSNVFHSRLAL